MRNGIICAINIDNTKSICYTVCKKNKKLEREA